MCLCEVGIQRQGIVKAPRRLIPISLPYKQFSQLAVELLQFWPEAGRLRQVHRHVI